MWYRATTAFCAVLLSSSPLLAQRGRGGDAPFAGPRGVLAFDLSDGEPVSVYLELASLLDLDDTQRATLMDLRRRLRVQNAPFMKQLDSLRELAGIELGERGRVTQRDAEALRRFRDWSAPVIDSIRLNNEGARVEIRQTLSEVQLVRADSIVQADRDGRRGRRRPGR